MDDSAQVVDATTQRAIGVRHHLLPIAALILSSGSFYIATLAPTVTAEDSGELITAAHSWGIPHPPGYPLWTMLCGLFIRVFPFGEIAYRANIFSAICASLSTVPLLAALIALRIRPAAAFATALAWAFTGTLWSQSVITEVYSLHALLCTLLIFTTVKWHVSHKPQWLVWASFIFGLGMCNQHTFGFVALAVGGWVLCRMPMLLKDWRLIAKCAAVFAIALMPYLYLPVRARTNPPMNWGNPASLDAFGKHVSRSQYGSTAPLRVSEDRSIKRLARQMKYVAGVVAEDLTIPLTCFALIGTIFQFRRRDGTYLLTLFIFVSSGLLFLIMSNIGLDRTFRHAMKVFFIPLSLGLTIPLACTLDQTIATASRGGRVLKLVTSYLVLATPLLPAALNYARCNYNNYWYAYDHAKNILSSMMPHAILFPSSDHNSFPLLYLTLVQDHRSDVTLADKYGYVDPAVLDSIESGASRRLHIATDLEKRKWIIEHASRPVYYSIRAQSPVASAAFVSVGLLYHLLPNGKALDRDIPWMNIHYRNLLSGESVQDLGASHILAEYDFFLALDMLRRGDQESALRAFASCSVRLHGIKEAYNNIGSALAEHALLAQAIEYFKEAIRLDSHYESPKKNLAKVNQQLSTARESTIDSK